MKKFISVLFSLSLIVPVSYCFADDEDFEEYIEYEDTEEYEEMEEDVEPVKKVVSRDSVEHVSCSDLKKELNDLQKVKDKSDEDIQKLTGLRVKYRSQCGKQASKRKNNVNINVVRASVVQVDENLCEDGTKPDGYGCCTGETYKDLGDKGAFCCLDDGETCFSPMTAKVETCEDGGTPDANGCCSGESYKNFGNNGAFCCLDDGTTCFEPIK